MKSYSEELISAIKGKMSRGSDGMWYCSECEYRTKYSTTLTRHVEAKHLQTSGFECSICQQFCPTRNSLMSHQYRKHDVRYAQSWSRNYIHNQRPLMKDPMLKQLRPWTSWWKVACSRTMMAFGSALNVDTTRRRYPMYRTMSRPNMSQLRDFLVLYVISIVPQDMLWWIISPDITSRNNFGSIPFVWKAQF